MNKVLIADAKDVILLSEQYPAVIVDCAKEIVECYETNRKCTKWLWDNHQMLKDYILAPIKKGSSSASKTFQRTFAVGKKYGDTNEFHKNKSVRNNAKENIRYQTARLDSMLKLYNEKNFSMVYDWIVATDVSKGNEKFADVSYLYMISDHTILHILAWFVMINGVKK